MTTNQTETETLLPNLEQNILTDKEGNPTHVILPYEKFVNFIESHGLDFTEEERNKIRKSMEDSAAGRRENFVPMDEI